MFPVQEFFHILGLAISVGMIAIMDFRLLGIGMRSETPAQLGKDSFFWTFDQMIFFALAIIFNYTVHWKVVQSGAPNGRIVACILLTLWSCVVFGAIFIGFLNSTLDINRV